MKTYLKTFSIGLVIAGLIYLIISSLMLLWGLRILFSAQDTMRTAVSALENQEYDLVLSELTKLEGVLDKARSWQKPSIWISVLPIFGDDYRVLDNVLIAGSELTTSLNTVLNILSENSISQIFSLESLDLQTGPAAYLEVHDEVLDAIYRLIDAANEANSLETNLLPQSIQLSVENLQVKLSESSAKLEVYLPLIENLPLILGKTQPHDLLFLLQNPHELRPTGGFIGTIGNLTLANGQLQEFYTDDVYNIDVHALGREELIAPQAIQDYTEVEYWYLRDANWYPDFPTSAKQVIDLYQHEVQDARVDSIIAVTPYAIQEFLKLTGPIEVDNIVFTSENLIDAIQFRVEQEFWRIGLSEEDRKIVINHLAQALKQRLFNLNSDEVKAVIDIFLSSLDRKEILLYTSFPSVQDYFVQQDWAGEIKPFEGDFLAVFDANLGALKTDRVVDRSREYNVTREEDGRYKAELKIAYKNNGFFDYRTTRYRTYTRVYVPLGSELISSTGFVKADKSRRYVDPEVYSEFNKTVFAGFLSIEPRQTRFAVIEYYLPARVQEYLDRSDTYELLVQKQPGVLDAEFKMTYEDTQSLFSFAPSSIDYTLVSETELSFTDILEEDAVYSIKRNP